MTRLALALTILTIATSCVVKGDSGVQCDEICTSELTLTLADGRESFQLQVYGEGLPTINVFCPDGIAAGVEDFTCAPGSLRLRRSAMTFPALLRVTLDDGPLQDLTPAYGDAVEVCSTTCADGEVAVAIE